MKVDTSRRKSIHIDIKEVLDLSESEEEEQGEAAQVPKPRLDHIFAVGSQKIVDSLVASDDSESQKKDPSEKPASSLNWQPSLLDGIPAPPDGCMIM